MNNNVYMKKLIAKSYSQNEADKFINETLTNKQFDTIKQCGIEIMKHVQPMPNMCCYLSAMLVDMAREAGIPAYLIAGKLELHSIKIFDYENSIENRNSVENWNGHCWAVFNRFIGDISFFRTAYSTSSPTWLNDLVVKSFGKNRGMLLGSDTDLTDMGFHYFPQYVFKDPQLDGLLKTYFKILKNELEESCKTD